MSSSLFVRELFLQGEEPWDWKSMALQNLYNSTGTIASFNIFWGAFLREHLSNITTITRINKQVWSPRLMYYYRTPIWRWQTCIACCSRRVIHFQFRSIFVARRRGNVDRLRFVYIPFVGFLPSCENNSFYSYTDDVTIM